VKGIARIFPWIGCFLCMTTAYARAKQPSASDANTAGQPATFTFTSFDPPGSVFTQAWAINNEGIVVGDYSDSSGAFFGYKRLSNGSFNAPITVAGENVYTDGINDYGVMAGYSSVGAGQGYPPPNPITTFTLLKGVYTDFTLGPDTQINAINNEGDFAGIFEENSGNYPGFLHVASTGSTEVFSVAGSDFTFAYGLNRKDVVVGLYRATVTSTAFGAFVRHPSGKILTFGFPGASSSGATNINNCGTIAGVFTDSAVAYHGFYGALNSFTQMDYPGAVWTIVTGMNDRGEIVGQYVDASEVLHGFIATPSVPSCSP
jgi:hypothetical protein